ncbi:MAG TPA: alpha/beta fold hydrolase, partial [Thermoanaerobaculia bacterium]
MTTRRVDLAPYSFRVRTGGRGTPVVLLHGLSGSTRWWDRTFEALARAHAVAAVELIGFGSNRSLPLPFDESVALLARWLGTAYGEPVHLVGHSMGGQLAIEAAARAPDRVASLTLVASSGIPFELRPRRHVRALFHQPPAIVSFGPRLAVDALRAGPRSIALASMRLLTRDSRPAMARISCPVRLVWGDSDPLIPLEYAEAIRGRI